MKIAVYAGSFDMPTKGHESVIRYASTIVDELVVAVGVNPAKTTMFTLQERLDMLRTITNQFANVSCSSFSVDQYQVNFAEEIGAKFIVRGLRNILDFISEQTMAEKNAIINPRIKTIFVMPDHKFTNVSSSTVKMMIGPKGWKDVVEHDIPDVMWPLFLDLVKRKLDI